MGIWEYVKVIIVILIVLFAAFYVTRLTAKASGGRYRRSSNIKLSGSLPLAKDKSVAVVEIGNYAYVLGVGQQVEMLDKLPLAELDLKAEQEPAADYSKYAESLKKEAGRILNKLRNPKKNAPSVLPGLSKFWKRFKEEFKLQLKVLLTRSKKGDDLPPKEKDPENVEVPPKKLMEFAELLKKERDKLK